MERQDVRSSGIYLSPESLKSRGRNDFLYLGLAFGANSERLQLLSVLRNGAKGLIEISNDVVTMFNPDAESNHFRHYAGRELLLS